jgi:hypothetical protein
LRTGDYKEALRRLRIEQGEAQKRLDDLQAKAARRSAAELSSLAGQPLEFTAAELELMVASWAERERERILATDKFPRSRGHIEDLVAELKSEEAQLKSPVPEDYEALVGGAFGQVLATAGLPMTEELGPVRLSARNAGAPAFRLSPQTQEELYRLVRRSLALSRSASIHSVKELGSLIPMECSTLSGIHGVMRRTKCV